MKKICVVHGPNLNLLGTREPEIYGRTTLDEVDAELKAIGEKLKVEVTCFQSNHEGAIVDKIQDLQNNCDGLIINPGAYTHTSIAIRDALLSLTCPVIEVHVSNVYKRESFRHHSYLADVVTGRIIGLGVRGYGLALKGLMEDI